MATYCFRCTQCGNQVTHGARIAPTCHGTMVRDWRSENVDIGSGVRVSRDGTTKDISRLFLPSADEFVGPNDPDGSKGIRKWNETHTNENEAKAIRPEMPRKVY